MYSHVACDVMKEQTLYLLKPSSLIWHLMPYLFLLFFADKKKKSVEAKRNNINIAPHFVIQYLSPLQYSQIGMDERSSYSKPTSFIDLGVENAGRK